MSYAVFLVSFVYAAGFTGSYLAPKSIGIGGRADVSEASLVGVLLLGLFAIQHSIVPHVFSRNRVEDRPTQGSWEYRR